MIIAYVCIHCNVWVLANKEDWFFSYMDIMHSYYRFYRVSEITDLEECFQHWPKLKELQWVECINFTMIISDSLIKLIICLLSVKRVWVHCVKTHFIFAAWIHCTERTPCNYCEMASPKGGQPLYSGQIPYPRLLFYRNITFGTSEKRTPLYSGQWTVSMPPKDNNLYKITFESGRGPKLRAQIIRIRSNFGHMLLR